VTKLETGPERVISYELSSQWSRSNPKRLDDYSYGSNYVASWVCIRGHSWTASVKSRFKGGGCPYCQGRKLLTGFNDLSTIYPELVTEWDYQQNQINPSNILPSSKLDVSWICSYRHCWQAPVNRRVRVGSKCPYCYGNWNVTRGVNDLKSQYPSLVREWDSNKNLISPDQVRSQSHLKAWWVCQLGHSWEAKIQNRVTGNGCPYCANKKVLAGFNNLAVCQERFQEFDLSKNSHIKPEMLHIYSCQKVWWLCRQGHSEYQRVDIRVKGLGCRICAGKDIQRGVNDLETLFPQLYQEFDLKKNIGSHPRKLRYLDKSRKYYWLCSEGHSWATTLWNRSQKGDGCPQCAIGTSASKPEIAVRDFLTSILPKGTSIKWNNRSLIFPLELDLYLPSLAIAIEFNGDYWHSNRQISSTLGISAREYHQKKKDICSQKGVTLVFIWEWDWKHDRTLIEECVIQLLTIGRIAPQLEKLTGVLDIPLTIRHKE
jgi:hypothetical protein